MASLKELDSTLPEKFRLSDSKLIFVLNIIDATIIYYDLLDQNTTIMLVNEVESEDEKIVFYKMIADIGSTVIDLDDHINNNNLSKRTKKIIRNILLENNYKQIITPEPIEYTKNEEIFSLVKKIIAHKNNLGQKKEVQYTLEDSDGPRIIFPCNKRKDIIWDFCSAISETESDKYVMYEKCIKMASKVRKLKKV
jgi:hypothetical protein